MFTFQPLTPLPSINSPTIVDGYSQSGASPNTLTGGNNAVLRIEIDGSQVVANAGEHIGLRLIGSTGNTVKGLIINGFDDVGVLLDSTGGHKVEGNWIGLDGDGVTAIGNGVGVDSKTAILNTIGGETPAARNVITGPGTGIRLAAGVGSLVQGNFIGTDKTGTAVVNNGASVGVLIDGTTGNGVLDKFSNGPSMPNVIGGWGTAGVQIVSGATGNFIAGNMIGTDLTGTLDLGNAIGVLINAPGNLVGTGTSAAGNTIAYNTGDGVRVLDGLGNRIRLNSFYENGALAIDLGGDGVTPNDPGDADSSPNGFQNFPVLLEINSLSGKATSTLDSTTSTEFQIDFYTSAACDPSGFGEARTIVGGVTVTTNASGTVVFGANLDRLKFDAFLTAQATDPNDNSSEFSACLAIPDQTIVVESPDDELDSRPGDGFCADFEGKCTLRAAIMEANNLPGPDTIQVPANLYNLTVEGSDENGAASGDLDVIGELTILGAGRDKTIIDANKDTAVDPDRVFQVHDGSVLTMKDLTFQNGSASDGGGLYNNKGFVTLERVVVANNNGDGLYNGSFNGDNATMMIVDSTIRHNTGDAVQLRGSHCCSPGAGNSTVTLLRSTIRNNSNGIALSHQHAFVRAYVINSTLAYNGADAVENNPSNSGFSRVYITHSTIVGHSRGLATGSASDGGNSRITIKNSILFGNSSNCSGSEATPHELLSAGNNISDDDTCAMFDEPGDMNNTDPLLGALADNSGITESFALLPGSPAIDAVTSTPCTDTNGDAVTDDQRGFVRPFAASCDVGAYEFGGGTGPDGRVVVGSGRGAVTPETGGTVDAGEGDVVTFAVDIPAGAVATELEVGIHSFDSADPALPSLLPASAQDRGVLGRAFTLSPAGVQFASPTTVTISYTQGHLDSRELIEGSLYPVLLVGGQWVKVEDCLARGPPSPDPCVVSHDTDTNIFTIETTHFSTYAFVGAILSDTVFVTSELDTVDATPGDGICADATGACTLRAAIIEANANVNVTNIDLPVGTYKLTIDGSGEDASATGDLDITSGLTITGAGSDVTTIDGNKGVVNDVVINVKTGATLTATDVTIANGDQTGLYNQGGTVTLDRVVVRNHDGYGIDNVRSGATASVTVRNSTIYGHTYGIRLRSGNTQVSRAYVSHSTVVGNTRGITTGSSGSSRFEVKNSIVANNSTDNCSGGESTNHKIVSLGNNLSNNASCPMFTQHGDLQNVDPLLGGLGDNSGITASLALLPGSPAIDAVTSTPCTDTGGTAVTTDQRGFAQPIFGRCDIGAFEFGGGTDPGGPVVVGSGLGKVTPEAGGTVDAGDIVTASVALPPGAVSSTFEVGIKSFEASDQVLPALPDGALGRNAFGRTFAFTPEGAQFESSTTITISYTQAHFESLELIEGSLYPVLQIAGQWVKVEDCVSQGPPDPDPCVVAHDISANTLTIETTHFSTYGFVGLVLPDSLVVTSELDTVDAAPGDGFCADASGDCTLRAAIMEANANVNLSKIDLPAGTYRLTIDGSGEDASATGDLDVTSGLTITGAGSDATTIDGNKGVVDDHAINIKAGATLSVTDVTIANGDQTGLYNQGGTVTLDRVVVRNHDGYGIDNVRSGATASITVRNSTIRNNGSGGVYTHSTSGFAGATIINSLIHSNSAYGIYVSNSNSTAQAVVTNSTIYGHTYGIRLAPGNTQLSRAYVSHSTIAGNGRGLATGGATSGGTSIFEVKNTIVANNSTDNCSGGEATNHTIVSLGNNLNNNASCPMFTEPGDLQNTDPMLIPS